MCLCIFLTCQIKNLSERETICIIDDEHKMTMYTEKSMTPRTHTTTREDNTVSHKWVRQGKKTTSYRVYNSTNTNKTGNYNKKKTKKVDNVQETSHHLYITIPCHENSP